jgi:hypothetical protein
MERAKARNMQTSGTSVSLSAPRLGLISPSTAPESVGI